MACSSAPANSQSGYNIIMLINGVPAESVLIRRVHNANDPEAMTAAVHTLVELFEGDVVTFVLVSDGKTYKIDGGHARLVVKKEPWY